MTPGPGARDPETRFTGTLRGGEREEVPGCGGRGAKKVGGGVCVFIFVVK